MNTRQIESLKAAILVTLSRTDNVGTLAVTTALVRLFARQTTEERRVGGTHESNGRGFNYYDGLYTYGSAKSGTYMAAYCLGSNAKNRDGVISPEKWDEEVVKLKSGRRTPIRLLSGKFLDSARRMAKFYIKQLVEEAVVKLEAKEQAELIAAQSSPDSYCDSYCPTPSSEELREAFAGPATAVPNGDECPSTARSPRFPFQSTERPILVAVL